MCKRILHRDTCCALEAYTILQAALSLIQVLCADKHTLIFVEPSKRFSILCVGVSAGVREGGSYVESPDLSEV